MRFQYCTSSKHFILYIRVIQGPSVGNMMALELMGRVAVSYDWK